MINRRLPALLLVLTVLSLAVVPASQAAVLTVTNTADDGFPGCLRWCIEHAQPGDEIRFDASLDGLPIVLTGGRLRIDKSLSITGRGPEKTIIDGNYTSGVFEVRCLACPGEVALSGMSIRNGRSRGSAGGVLFDGGSLTLTDCSISGNSATRGGAIRAIGGQLTLASSAVSDNSATGFWGGAIDAFGVGLTVLNSTIRDNSATSGGGGIAMVFSASTIHGSTISSNSTDGVGGGLLTFFSLSTISDSTINGNSALDGAGICDLFFQSRSTVRNTVVADHVLGGDCCSGNPGSVSLGHNLDSDGSCGFDQASDQPNTDPMLGPLEDNYGPTWTHAPLEGSPVIDRGWCDPGADQRGVPRPLDGNRDSVWICDIGAVEYVPYEIEVVGPGGDVIVIPPDSD